MVAEVNLIIYLLLTVNKADIVHSFCNLLVPDTWNLTKGKKWPADD